MILVSSHLCCNSAVQCGTQTRVFCRTRRRAGEPFRHVFLASVLALWHFTPVGIKNVLKIVMIIVVFGITI